MASPVHTVDSCRMFEHTVTRHPSLTQCCSLCFQILGYFDIGFTSVFTVEIVLKVSPWSCHEHGWHIGLECCGHGCSHSLGIHAPGGLSERSFQLILLESSFMQSGWCVTCPEAVCPPQ